jgi:transcriptional regulator GlxA family with amidase domain
VFSLAATGLLDGHEATTHWQYADQLAARHPDVKVRPEALYVDQGRIVTGAGAAAGMDMYLHLVRRDHGAAVTNAIARLLVVPPHRDGGQRQYISAPVPSDGDGERLAGVLAWARANLRQNPPVDALAARALMSRRSFIRHFKAATGATPHAWLLTQRLNLAEELLETTTLSMEDIAERVGYRSAGVLREQFTLRRGVAPRDYRRTFTHPPEPRAAQTSSRRKPTFIVTCTCSTSPFSKWPRISVTSNQSRLCKVCDARFTALRIAWSTPSGELPTISVTR